MNLAIARECAAVGANIALCGRTEAKLRSAAAELEDLGAKVAFSVADVRDQAAMDAAFGAAAHLLGPMDAVVCGAAGNFLSPAEDLSSNGFRAVVDIDLLGSFHTTKAAFDQLRETRGVLLFVSGGQSQFPFVHQAHVSAAKAGVDQLMRSLALEWARFGIRSNSIVPGPVEGTEGMVRLAATAGRATWEQMIPLGRFGRQEEVGRMAALVLSPVASFMTGTQVVVDGGLSLSGTGAFNAALLAAD